MGLSTNGIDLQAGEAMPTTIANPTNCKYKASLLSMKAVQEICSEKVQMDGEKANKKLPCMQCQYATVIEEKPHEASSAPGPAIAGERRTVNRGAGKMPSVKSNPRDAPHPRGSAPFQE
ncbi:unnamed protein product [Polarella glacialis]|uniref:Uncharacterized protein n=1 Tax=Polarella glacialis TaxID=89957 RepID=A0A813FV92_POLGL|nr:unnamed protein product [Polarella glacialis]